MSDVVSYEVEDGIAVITVNNPPVNALSHAVRSGLMGAIERMDGDAGAQAGVIVCEGRTFLAGADISEFGKPPKEPGLGAVVDRIEAAAKPVVAALHGTPLGGGLEVALGAHYRVAAPGTRVGLPEVHLGIIPGAGGTQRLPRVAGAEAAVEMITSGRHVPIKEAHAKGIVDEIAEGDPRAAGIAFAKALIADGKGPRPTGALEVKDASPALFEKIRAEVAKKAKGQLSPMACVDAVEAATLPIAEGLKREREVFNTVYNDPQRAALVHAFFSERAVAKVPEVATEPRTLETIGVIGGGTMGAGITAAALNAGLKVVMVERDAESLAKGIANLRRNYASSVAKGRMTQEALDGMLDANFSGACEYEALADIDLLIEAVFENMDVKKEVFRAVDPIIRDGAVLASNTSYLDIDEIAAVTKRPEDVIGLHFFSPAHIMRLLEVVVGEKSATDAVSTGFALARKMKKVGVRAGVCDGFIGNRILATYARCAGIMVMDGASPYVIDQAVKEFGYPMGPFAMSDLAGLDIGYSNRKNKKAAGNTNQRYVSAHADRMVENGWHGQKTGKGYYVYEDGARNGPPNTEVMEIIKEERAKDGGPQREFSKDEIIRRYIAAMVNEAAKVLGDGIALRPLDIDMTALFGYGFPRWRGGPMHYADEVGIAKIFADIKEFEKEDPVFWAPAPLLEQMVKDGTTFADMNKG